MHEPVDADRVAAATHLRHGGYEDFTLALAEQEGELVGFA